MLQCCVAAILLLVSCWAPVAQGEDRQVVSRTMLDLPYVQGGSEKQKVDVYLPKSVAPQTGYPVVMWIHGGGWAKGSRKNYYACKWVLKDGYAIVSVGYRLTDEAIFPAQLEDCKEALRWIRAHQDSHHLDPERIVVWGSSAGGHLACMVGLTGSPSDPSGLVKGIVDWFGPTDLLRMQKQRRLPTQLNADLPDSFESRLVGGTLQEQPSAAKAASPLSHVSRDDPPLLIVHGDQDPLVPIEQSKMLVEAYREKNLSAKLLTLPGAKHGGNEFQTDATRQVIRAFLISCFE